MEYETDAQVAKKRKPKLPSKATAPLNDSAVRDAAKSSASAAKSSLQAADSIAVATDTLVSSVEIMQQSQVGLVQALQETINNGRDGVKREPVRLKVNRVWDKATKANLIDSIDVLPLTAKS